ncbi:MAG: 23S rRNA (guanosine(2251)-2'-O)-methyltransferase RlmB [Gammaproteobacteria bacterium]|nr:23S rRNA (guanosine(2251)-2'-O)-methyltransferase RlmB [Gammaproteobacteria bacterium]
MSNKKQVVYGFHAVAALLNSQPHTVRELFVQRGRDDKRLKEILAVAEQHSIGKQIVAKDKLDKLFPDYKHQGVLVVVTGSSDKTYREHDLPALLDNLSKPVLLLILDGVQDPHNLGACLRSANAAGVHAVIIPKDNAVGLTPVVRKAAAGAAEEIPLVQVTNLARTMAMLKDRGIWLYGADGEAEAVIYDTDLRGNVGLVLGAEGKGLRRLTAENCDGLVKIPMAGTVSSLNVSVATGICLFEAKRQQLVNAG